MFFGEVGRQQRSGHLSCKMQELLCCSHSPQERLARTALALQQHAQSQANSSTAIQNSGMLEMCGPSQTHPHPSTPVLACSTPAHAHTDRPPGHRRAPRAGHRRVPGLARARAPVGVLARVMACGKAHGLDARQGDQPPVQVGGEVGCRLKLVYLPRRLPAVASWDTVGPWACLLLPCPVSKLVDSVPVKRRTCSSGAYEARRRARLPWVCCGASEVCMQFGAACADVVQCVLAVAVLRCAHPTGFQSPR